MEVQIRFLSEVMSGLPAADLMCTAGKKDTPVASVQAVTYVVGQLPAGMDRVATILAGRIRTTLPIVDENRAMTSAFSTSPGQTARGRTTSWRGFAAHAMPR